jgi:hypothetical protein
LYINRLMTLSDQMLCRDSLSQWLLCSSTKWTWFRCSTRLYASCWLLIR